MSAIIRTLIVWLALLAVPFQGFASAAMLPHVPAPAAALHKHHSHAMAGHSQHQCAAHAEHTCSPDHAQHGSKCGACCGGAAMVPPPLAPVAPPAAAATRVLVDSGCPPSAELELPDRPPRSLHA